MKLDLYDKLSINLKSQILSFTTIELTLFVVIGHITRMYTSVGLFSSQLPNDPAFSYVTNFVYSFHMPAFMAVSGGVFSLCFNDLGKYGEPKTFVKNKALRLLIPYFFFLLLFVNPVLLYVGKLDGSLCEVILNNIMFCGDARHLWFLPTLFGCFMLIYPFRKFISRYSLVTLCITLFALTISVKLTIPLPVLPATLYYLFFFYLGYFLLCHLNLFKFIKSTVFLIGTFLPIAVYCTYTQFFPLKLMLNVLGIFFSFGFGWRMCTLIKHSGIIKSFSKNSFGIYLFHPLIIYVAFFLTIKFQIQVNPILFAISLLLLVLALSVFLTEAFRKFHLHRAIGEPPPKAQ